MTGADMKSKKITFHPVFQSVFNRNELAEIYAKSAMHTCDKKGRVDLVLILSEMLDAQIEVAGENLQITNLTGSEKLTPDELLARIVALKPSEVQFVVLDDKEGET